jgi:hypothetical protein
LEFARQRLGGCARAARNDLVRDAACRTLSSAVRGLIKVACIHFGRVTGACGLVRVHAGRQGMGIDHSAPFNTLVGAVRVSRGVASHKFGGRSRCAANKTSTGAHSRAIRGTVQVTGKEHAGGFAHTFCGDSI